jgi:hypothetical protein
MIGTLRTERGRWEKYYLYFTILCIFWTEAFVSSLLFSYSDFLVRFVLPN